MQLDDLVVEVRRADLTRVGQIPPEFLDCRLEPQHVGVGAWAARLPAQHPMAAALSEPGSGIIVTHWRRVVTNAEPDTLLQTNLLLNPAGVNGAESWETNGSGTPGVMSQGPALGPFATSARHTRTSTGATRATVLCPAMVASATHSIRLRVRASEALGGVTVALRPARTSGTGATILAASVTIPAGESDLVYTAFPAPSSTGPLTALSLSWSSGSVGSTLDVVGAVVAGNVSPSVFSGDLPAADGIRYSWAGAGGASESLRWQQGAPGTETVIPEVVLSGPTDDPETTATTDDPEGTARFVGTTDNVLLWQRNAYPTPSMPVHQQVSAYDVVTAVPGETAMQHYVNVNVGPGARPERQALTLEPDQGRGSLVTKSARFDVLGDLLASIATAAGLGFRVVQVGDVLEFQTFEVRDRSNVVRLDIANGTLASQTVKRRRPRLTHAIVAGQGEGEDRTLLEVATTDPSAALYGPFSRREGFQDQRNTDDPLELTQAGQEALLDAAGSIAVTAVPGDDSTMRYPQDWREGDTIAVVIGDQEPSAVVTGVTILVNASAGVRVGASIGDVVGWDPQAPLRARQDAQEQRLGHLERNLESAVQGNVAPGVDLDDLDRAGRWLVDTTALAATLAHLPVPPLGDYRAGSVGTLTTTVDPGTGRVVQQFDVATSLTSVPLVMPYRRVRSDGVWGPWLLGHQYATVETANQQHTLAHLRSQPHPRSPMVVTRLDGAGLAPSVEALTTDGVQWLKTGGGPRVPTPSWRSLTLGAGWAVYGAGAWSDPQCVRLASGIVLARGLAKNGAQNTTLTTLPAGYRPARTLHFYNGDSGASGGGHLEVRPDGQVIWRGSASGGAAWVDMFHPMFPAADVAPDSAWTPITDWAAGWEPFPETDPDAPVPSYWVDPYGQVWFRGRVRKAAAGDPGLDTAMFYVPGQYAPNLQVHSPALAAQAPRYASLHWVASGGRTGVFYKTGSPSGAYTWVSLAQVYLHPVAAIPETSWRTTVLSGGWLPYSGSFPTPGVWARPDGLLQFRGLMRAGSTGAASAAMGVNDRPVGNVMHYATAVNAMARIGLEGNVLQVFGGNNAWLTLDGLHYLMEG